ncbi:MAG: DoxX family protein [Myxococcota bacterium]
MLIPQLASFEDVAVLCLRIVLAVVFVTSGWSHLTRPAERGESIGLSQGTTALLGAVEVVGGGLVALGILPQVGGLLLAGVMLGAIYKKLLVWGTGFWGERNDGWYYDLLYLVGLLVVVTSGGGALTFS